MGLSRVVGYGNGFVGVAVRFGQVFFVGPQVQGALNLIDVIFQAFKGIQEQGIVHVHPFQGRREGRQVVEIGVDDDVHGQVDGHFAVLLPQFFGPDEVEGDDVEDFMLNRALHLFRRQGQEEHGIEIEVVPRPLEVGPCRRGHVEADFLDHLEEKIAEEIVLVFHEVAVDAVQEGVEFLLEIGRHIRDAASPALLGEDGVGDDRCLLIEEVSRNGQ